MWLYGNIDCQSPIPPAKITPRFITSLCGYVVIWLYGYMEIYHSLMLCKIFPKYLIRKTITVLALLCPYVVIWKYYVISYKKIRHFCALAPLFLILNFISSHFCFLRLCVHMWLYGNVKA